MYARFLFLLISAPLFFSCSESSKEEQERPNILWIVSEDNSPLLGCYGDTFATTPVLDKLASEGILFENAFATAPACAPSRSTLITGVYPPSMGTQNMRSEYAIPSFIKFYPKYLREAGYYTSNNTKKDYNLSPDQENAWNESSDKATYKNREHDQPFFSIFNLTISHESSIHKPLDTLMHDPKLVPIPPYHPRTPEMEHDWAQYYDKVQMMDAQVGGILEELEKDGLTENTIIFYYSDHGGVVARSKRFMYESGLHIPLIIRCPEKYKHLLPKDLGARTDRIVTFLDFAPTLLSLAGIPIPDYMMGKAFLGKQATTAREYAYGFRDRMDEVYDLNRGVRDKQYRYIRNYMPHRAYGQYLQYLWHTGSLRSWEQAFKNGELNDVQSVFWKQKPPEELYDVLKDPHNVNNLAIDPAYSNVLEKMRTLNQQYILETHDSGFMPESEMISASKGSTIYDYVHSDNYPLEKILATAEMATIRDASNLPELIKRMDDADAVVRYWAATGCVILQNDALPAKAMLVKHANDSSVAVTIAVAEALYGIGDKETSLAILRKAIAHPELTARVHALNVIRLIGVDALPLLPDIESMPGDTSSNEYDMRSRRSALLMLRK
jgi:arylsulfatase A-like enzyme